MTKIKYIRNGWDIREDSLEDYVVDTLMDIRLVEGRQETIEARIEEVIKSFGKLIEIMHDKNQLTLPEIEVILCMYENLNYKED
jgi:hypothetical protein